MTTTFKHLKDATADDWAAIIRIEEDNQRSRNAGAGLLRLLEIQRDDPDDGWPINVYRHCLQSATLAHKAGADDELIFCALFHDACEIVAPIGHGAATAKLLAPYISEERRWMVEHHPVFQNAHMTHHPFRDRTAFEQYRGHPAFEETVEFCRLYDANAFDPDYQEMPLEAFAPLVDRVCRGQLPQPGGM